MLYPKVFRNSRLPDERVRGAERVKDFRARTNETFSRIFFPETALRNFKSPARSPTFLSRPTANDGPEVSGKKW